MSDKNPFSAKPKKKASAEKKAPAIESESVVEENRELPPLTMEEKKCRSCRFYFFGETIDREYAARGQCRRNSPRPGPGSIAQWPAVVWENWCGEWENGVSQGDMVRMARDVGDNIDPDGPLM